MRDEQWYIVNLPAMSDDNYNAFMWMVWAHHSRTRFLAVMFADQATDAGIIWC